MSDTDYVAFKDSLVNLKRIVRRILKFNNVDSIWNDAAFDIYTVAKMGLSPNSPLYAETKSLLYEHLSDLSKDISSHDKNALLKNYLISWMKYRQSIDILNNLYVHQILQIDREKIPLGCFRLLPAQSYQKGPSINAIGVQIWKEMITIPLREILVKQIFDCIESDRTGTLTSPEVVQDVIRTFLETTFGNVKDVAFYQSVYEKPFLEWTSEYYKREAAKLLKECTVSQYIETAVKKLKEEIARAYKFLYTGSVLKVIERFQRHILIEHLAFVCSECQLMIRNEQTKDLVNLYILLEDIPVGIQQVIDEWYEYITNEGRDMIAKLTVDKNVHIHYVENIVNIYKKFRKLICELFCNDPKFIAALDKSCVYLINSSNQLPSSSELIAKYCDYLLKNKKLSESEFEKKLEDSIILFQFIEEKNVFHKIYARFFFKRLIYDQRANMDAEQAMIHKLQLVHANEFTYSLQPMYKDIVHAHTINNKFTDYLASQSLDLHNFSIYILKAKRWPLELIENAEFKLPQALTKPIQHFNTFYNLNFACRNLNWQFNLSQIEVKLTYLNKTYWCTMQTFQLAILLLFENSDSLSVEDIQGNLGLPSKVCKANIRSLIVSGLLLSDTKEITDDSAVRLNLNYKNSRVKFTIGSMKKDTAQEHKQTVKAVEEDLRSSI